MLGDVVSAGARFGGLFHAPDRNENPRLVALQPGWVTVCFGAQIGGAMASRLFETNRPLPR